MSLPPTIIPRHKPASASTLADPMPMDKKGRLFRPEEDSHSSSRSGAETTRTRYKPLAPRQLSAPETSVWPPELEGEPSPAADLMFVNFTDPSQSKSQESRKLVRTQVMRNFARDQKRQKARGQGSDMAREGCSASPSTVSIAQSYVTTTARPSAGIMSETFRPRTPRTRSLPPAFEGANAATSGPAASGVGKLIWPVIMEPQDEVLKNHCLSPGFRASNPLYMISLLVKRLGADRYPLMVDIDSSAGVPSPVDVEQNLLYRLAEGSASLAHAIMMVSASDLALRQVNKSTSERLVLYHNSRALALLNEAIQDVQSSCSLETLATAAVLACHELVVGDYKAWTVHILGFSRMIAMNGGINYLDPENPIRQLILWSDQVGALFMNARPLFPASAVFASFSRLSQNLSPQVAERYHEGGFQGLLSWQRMQAEGKLSDDLLDIISDINLVAFIGAQFLLDETVSVTHTISLRDQIIHRLLYLVPRSQEGSDEASHEACVGLAMLLLTFDRLFSPVLPAAYFQLTHLVADRLAGVLAGSRDLASEWAGHEWAALWVCFVGTSGSTTNPSARRCFVRAGAPFAKILFRGVEEMDGGLEAGLKGFASGPGYYGRELVEAFVGGLREEVLGGLEGGN